MIRRLALSLAALALALAVPADLPPLQGRLCIQTEGQILYYNGSFYRPVTLLMIEKSGIDAVLTWTVDPEGSYNYIVTRGLLQPAFLDQVIVHETTNLTWTDVGAITRTVMGELINEYYFVWATGEPVSPPLAAMVVIHEYKETPRNRQHLIKWTVLNGEQYPDIPGMLVEGRDHNASIQASKTGTEGVYFFDAENLPTPGGAVGLTVAIASTVGEWQNTVDHGRYYSGSRYTAESGNHEAPDATQRSLPVPATSRDGNVVTASWTAPTQDTEGSLVSFSLYRTYLGTAGPEASVLVSTGPISTLEAQDDISAVPADDYCFWHLVFHYSDGRTTADGPSSLPVRR